MRTFLYNWKRDGRFHWKQDFPFSAPAIHSFAAMTRRCTHRVQAIVKKPTKASA